VKLAGMDLELRAITDDERRAFNRAVATAFGGIPTEAELDEWGDELAVDRTLAAFDGDEIVANAGAYTFELTVPGGARVPTAGVTVVGVRATHRRRGLLTRMMDEQLDDVAQRGEPLAALTASESSIYGRFGYGQATSSTWWQLTREGTAFASPSAASGTVRLVDRDTALAAVPAVYDGAARARVGEVTRSEKYWERVYKEGRQPASPSGDGTPFFTAVHYDAAGSPDAFARYSVKGEWPHGRAANVLRVHEAHATAAEAEAALWEYLLGVDLVGSVRADDRPVEEPLRWRLADPRRVEVTQLTDHLWVRVVDVAAAMSARTYATDDALVLALVDPFRPINDGAWLVEGGPGGATCARTDRDPDLVLSAADLGALYLGGVSASTLALAGRVEERTRGAVARADRFLASHPAPWCSTHF
jgi:predicted acetyltransferase